jgi:hypothetical protein
MYNAHGRMEKLILLCKLPSASLDAIWGEEATAQQEKVGGTG